MKIVLARQFSDNLVTSDTFRTTSTALMITVDNIHNPYSMKPSTPVMVETQTSTGGIMSQSPTVMTMTSPNIFPSVLIYRSATDVSVGVELKFSFRVTN